MLCFNGFDITCLFICCPCVFLSLNLLVSLIWLPFSSSNLYLPLCFHPLFTFQYSLCALLTSYLVSFSHQSFLLCSSHIFSNLPLPVISHHFFCAFIRFCQIYILSLPQYFFFLHLIPSLPLPQFSVVDLLYIFWFTPFFCLSSYMFCVILTSSFVALCPHSSYFYFGSNIFYILCPLFITSVFFAPPL